MPDYIRKATFQIFMADIRIRYNNVSSTTRALCGRLPASASPCIAFAPKVVTIVLSGVPGCALAAKTFHRFWFVMIYLGYLWHRHEVVLFFVLMDSLSLVASALFIEFETIVTHSKMPACAPSARAALHASYIRIEVYLKFTVRSSITICI